MRYRNTTVLLALWFGAAADSDNLVNPKSSPMPVGSTPYSAGRIATRRTISAITIATSVARSRRFLSVAGAPAARASVGGFFASSDHSDDRVIAAGLER